MSMNKLSATYKKKDNYELDLYKLYEKKKIYLFKFYVNLPLSLTTVCLEILYKNRNLYETHSKSIFNKRFLL